MNESISAWWWAALVVSLLYAALGLVVLGLSFGWRRQGQALRRQVEQAEAQGPHLVPMAGAQPAAADQAVQAALRANRRILEQILQGAAGPIIAWLAYRLLPPGWRRLAAAGGRQAIAMGARALAPEPPPPPGRAAGPGRA